MRTLFTFDQSILAKLIALKGMMLVVAASIAIIATTIMHVDLNPIRLTMVLGLGFAVCLLWFGRLLLPFPASEPEILLLLASDVLVLFLLIGVTGGGQNPFTSSLLIPLALSVALLKKRYSIILVMVSIAIYAYWTFAGQHHADHQAFSLHLYGMWINFLISAILLFIFIAYAMESVREREKQLQVAREKILNDEKLVAIATVAASTSHALGSPLSTMAILLEDAEQQGELDADNIHLLQQQIACCKQHLSQIADTARSLDVKSQDVIQVSVLLDKLREHFQIVNPSKQITFDRDASVEKLAVFFNQSLFMAIVNLVDNAVQVAVKQTQIKVRALGQNICIDIQDDGPGLAKDIHAKLGQAFISTKPEGWGLGIYLANSTIEHFHGTITLANHAEGGTVTQIVLPVAHAY